MKRREFIRTVISGAALSCAFPEHLLAEGATSRLGGEANALCHRVRDGEQFRFPPPEKHYEAIIVGGGPSGLAAAYTLRDRNILLVEKEPRVGGNAISEQWEGVWYSTGVAWNSATELESFCDEIGMKPYRINSIDAAIIDGQLVPEFWGEGIHKAPYRESVRKSFIAFKRDMLAIDPEKNKRKLDRLTFAQLMKPYAIEVKQFFDNYGPNNWGAKADATSAYVGVEAMRWCGGVEPHRFTFPGGLGRISEAMREKIESAGAGRVLGGATALRVANRAGRVEVSYFHDGEIRTLSAGAAIMAAPKFIAKLLIAGLPADQREAMNRFRYAPYLVVNVCMSEAVYDRSFDTNIPAPSLIVDFNVADWVINRDGGDMKRKHVLTCYVPLPEMNRILAQSDDYVTGIGNEVVDQLERWFPGARSKVMEVRIYRRGHPMMSSIPGLHTRFAPVASRPFGKIFFANTDSVGASSDFAYAISVGRKSAMRAMVERRSRR